MLSLSPGVNNQAELVPEPTVRSAVPGVTIKYPGVTIKYPGRGKGKFSLQEFFSLHILETIRYLTNVLSVTDA
jgi:hypothetical protein